MTTKIANTLEKQVRLMHSTAYFRLQNGCPEMIFENGYEGGSCYVVGSVELRKIVSEIEQLLSSVE
jgi:hypothetical protein